MRNIFGVVMRDEMQLWRGLVSIPGIGQKSAFKICEHVGLMPKTPFSKVTEKQAQSLEAFIESKPSFTNWWKLEEVGPSYRRKMKEKREKLISLNHIRGQRLAKGLPVRGQKTRNNAITTKAQARKGIL